MSYLNTSFDGILEEFHCVIRYLRLLFLTYDIQIQSDSRYFQPVKETFV